MSEMEKSVGYKVAVYAICRDERGFVEQWMSSMGEADMVCVLDTGSMDDTPQRLIALGAQVSQACILPWRFDHARNASLELVPQDVDICVCTDLDEIFRPGWREHLEQQWTGGMRRGDYRYIWSFNPDGSEGCVFRTGKIHSRKGYSWKGPVHEVLIPTQPQEEEPMLHLRGITLEHYPDPYKSRAQYLPLLELAVEEEPCNHRYLHYLGREYMFRGRWSDSVRTLQRYLLMPQANWPDERSASMRYIARAFEALGRIGEAESWYLRAAAEAPGLREPWLDYGVFASHRGDWKLLVWLCERALSIKTRPETYISEASSWGSLPYDLYSLGLYYTGNYAASLEAANRALELSPSDERLIKNKNIIAEKQGIKP